METVVIQKLVNYSFVKLQHWSTFLFVLQMSSSSKLNCFRHQRRCIVWLHMTDHGPQIITVNFSLTRFPVGQVLHELF